MQPGPAYASRPSLSSPAPLPALDPLCSLLATQWLGRGGRQKPPDSGRQHAPAVAESVGVGGAEQSPPAEASAVGDEGEERLEGGGG